ncbi:DUF935 domain-containing protein [Desulfonema ishimotonii]|uniref:DUF935 domain-containing protein n=1 Tax=Desulfonema ishimotonii TaxID=45657 RepID=A0A401FZX6_9BACT|nr:DUF935 family protein [Desulfonema ishimotonii]GBC62496.1 DUF935 domain-containing protein [Desulfonema ishimotonii]
MSGIWLDSHTFHNFSDAPGRSTLLSEIATREAAGADLIGYIGLLPDPDPILRKRGDSAAILEELTSDDQVCMAIQNRKLGTLLRRHFQFLPGAAPDSEPTAGAKALAENLQADLKHINLYDLISEVLDAPYFGFAPAELLWEPDNGRLRLKNIVVKPRAWFGFGEDNDLRFLRMGALYGDPVPDHKFVLARHFPTYENPYGLRLLSRCLWPVAFKRGGIRFWTEFIEKFGAPWVVGQAHQGATEKDRNRMLSDLTAMVRTACAVISAGSDVEIHEPSGKSGDLHLRYCDTWNAAISKVLMGQTLTSELYGQGSRAASETHFSVLENYRDADAHIVASFFDSVALEYGAVTAPDEIPPRWDWNDPDDQGQTAELTKSLTESGVTFRKTYFMRRFDLADDEFDIGAESDRGSGTSETALSSPASGFTPDQQALEDMADALMPEAREAAAQITDAIRAACEAAESYEELEALLADVLGTGSGTLPELMERAMIAARMWGEYNG